MVMKHLNAARTKDTYGSRIEGTWMEQVTITRNLQHTIPTLFLIISGDRGSAVPLVFL